MATFSAVKAPLAGAALGRSLAWGQPSCRWIVDDTAEVYVDPGEALFNGEPIASAVDLVAYSGAGIMNADAPSIFPPPGEWSGASLDDLEAAVHVSLFTDRRVARHELHAGSYDRRGFWGDSFPEVEGDEWGGRVWLTERDKLVDDSTVESGTTPEKVGDRVREALNWLVEDGVATRLEVEVVRLDEGAGVRIGIVRERDDDPISILYEPLWEARRG